MMRFVRNVRVVISENLINILRNVNVVQDIKKVNKQENVKNVIFIKENAFYNVLN